MLNKIIMEAESVKNKDFTTRLKELRMQKGLSQRAFTKLMAMNYTQYNRYERGESIPSTETLIKLADYLDVSVDYLLEGTEKDAAIANLADRDLLKIFAEVEKLPEEKKNAIKIILESVVKETKHQQLAS